MTRFLHNILNLKVLFFAVCLGVSPMVAAQDFQHVQTEMEQNQIAINVSESTLRVKNAEGLVVEIFSLTGEKVYTLRIESASKTIDLAHLQKGFYIVKIGKYIRKIYLH